MNSAIQFEDRVSRSRSKHEGESSASPCDRLSRTRVSSQRQLPTDHDYALPTREYQPDQSSPLPATAAADLVLEVQRQKHPHRFADIDRSHHIRGSKNYKADSIKGLLRPLSCFIQTNWGRLVRPRLAMCPRTRGI